MACPGKRTMKLESISRHCKGKKHPKNFEKWSANQITAVASPLFEDDVATNSASSPTEASASDDHSALVDTTMATADLDSDPDHNQEDFRRRAIVDMWTRDYHHIFDLPGPGDESINNSEDEDIVDCRMSDNESDVNSKSSSDDSCDLIERTIETDPLSWAPFSSLEQMVGLLILGSGRSTMSVDQYEKVRSYIGLLHVKLPGYQSLQHCRSDLKKRYSFDVSESLSPLEKPCFRLQVKQILTQEVANPFVIKHLQSIPELPGPTDKVNRLSQSRKWREELDKDLRVQMVNAPRGHFYLFEPVELNSGKLVIPVFFYQQDNQIFAKCTPARLVYQSGEASNGPQIRVQFRSTSDFNSESLASINVTYFSKVFEDIEVCNDILLKDNCGDEMYEDVGGIFVAVPIRNLWRRKSGGKIIRHIPLVLYCDDLSGNISKKWNKHMAFYFTLAGLPPKLSNQEYNCHFLTTSNTAGALELADPVIDEINKLSSDGFMAYDHVAEDEVLVVPFVLCHLGDSPMHAEVTNTMNPTVSLTPCRICDLKVETLMDKRSTKYVSNFVGVGEDGTKFSLPLRSWSETKKGTHDLWDLAQRPGMIGAFESESAALGIRDPLNMFFVKKVQDLHRNPDITKEDVAKLCKELNEIFQDRIFNPFIRLKGFDGHRDTPVEILHVVLLGVAKYLLRNRMQRCSAKEKNEIWGRWRSFNISGLNVPPIQPTTMINHLLSLTGKDFRVVLQAAPFIFFHCEMSPEEREAWLTLTHLAPYVFQTEITDVEKYIKDLERHIEMFLKAILQLSAQWCNKPKFHMLVHLSSSICRFVPPSLFATENFEGYNGNTQNHSIHSNHRSPGRDIANSSNNHRLTRSITSGAPMYDKVLKSYVRASKKVTDIFKTNKLFQKSMGYNFSWNQPGQLKTGNAHDTQPSNPRSLIPSIIYDAHHSETWKLLMSMTLTNDQKVMDKDFVSAKLTSSPIGKMIGRVQNIWGFGKCDPEHCVIELIRCKTGDVSVFYGMREIKQTQDTVWVNPGDIDGVLNIQHDCHQSGCTVEKIRPVMIERKLSKSLEHTAVYIETNQFVLNAGGFYSAQLNREWGQLSCADVCSEDWMKAIKVGLKNWEDSVKEKQMQKENRDKKTQERNLARQEGRSLGRKRKRVPISLGIQLQGPVAGPST
ncbi:hypothetical protein DFH28DRAFT_1152318 [Melampsora americana]|nr:hypothetical protein DFH28DRAFT_1152318 [Melampsora americana]